VARLKKKANYAVYIGGTPKKSSPGQKKRAREEGDRQERDNLNQNSTRIPGSASIWI